MPDVFLDGQNHQLNDIINLGGVDHYIERMNQHGAGLVRVGDLKKAVIAVWPNQLIGMVATRKEDAKNTTDTNQPT